MSEQLRELERKLAEAKAPSRELDELILHACNVEHSCELHSLNLTDSLDKAVAFAEAMLKDAPWEVDYHGHSGFKPEAPYCASVYPNGSTDSQINAVAWCPALALCLATIRALLAKETG